MAKARKSKKTVARNGLFSKTFDMSHQMIFSTFLNPETMLFAGSPFYFCHFQFYILLQRLAD
jgi:hypothetical protein